MFLQVSVCPQREGGMPGRGVCMVGTWCRGCVHGGGVHGRGHAWWGGHVWLGVCMGVCIVGGMCGRGACMARGHAWQGGHVWQILRDTVNERAICILPEYILVLVKLSKSKSQLVHSDSKVSDCSGRSRNYQRDAILSGGSRISQIGVPTQDGVINLLLPPTNEVWGKVIFLHLSVILFTRGSTREGTALDRYTLLWVGTPLGRYTAYQVHPLAGTPPRQVPPGRYPPGQVHPLPTVHAGIWSTSGQYASYWNEFLFGLLFCQKLHENEKLDWEGAQSLASRKSTTGLEW